MRVLVKGFTLFSAFCSRSFRLCRMSVHKVAEAGFQKGAHYNANRPSYSEEAVDLITGTISGIQTRDTVTYDVLELGAGTGLFTKRINKKLPKTSRYLATEPSAGFLPVLQESCPDVEIRPCAADSIPLSDSAVKTVICAQCFHWFPYSHVLDEIRRVMVDGGKLILIWNKKDWSVPWISEIQSYISTEDDTRPVHNVGGYLAWREVFQDYTGFKDEKYIQLPGVEFKGNQDFVVDHMSSISVMAGLSEERARQALGDIRAILQKHPETKDNDVIQIPFTTEGGHYDANRPTYTKETIDLIAREITQVENIENTKGIQYDVLELGAGTGIFTRKIFEKLPQGTRYLATEPSDAFLQTLKGMSPNLDAKNCAADSIPLPDNSVKAVLCAQCFHWFSTTAALDEMRRVLVDQGKLVLVWNMRDVSVPWVKQIEGVVAKAAGQGADKLPTTFNWRKVMQGYSGFRNEAHQRKEGTPLQGTVEAILKYYSTFSMICALEEQEQRQTLAEIRDILDQNVAGKDIGKYPFNTEIYTYICNKS